MYFDILDRLTLLYFALLDYMNKSLDEGGFPENSGITEKFDTSDTI